MQGNAPVRWAPTILLLWALAASGGFGQEWAKEMFDHTSHDFGTVARGAKVEHTFTLENIWEEDVHIKSVRSSCGCTTPKISKDTLKTWEKAQITAVVDTRTFLGQKQATLTVKLDKPFPAEAQLNIHCYIRSDVVVPQGVVQFGSVPQGTAAQQQVNVDYAGRPDWRIQRVECGNPHIEAQAVEASRTGGQVSYVLQVKLKNTAPVGYIRDHLVLVTNDTSQRATRVPVPVEGAVIAGTRALPPTLLLGVVEAGQTITRQVTVQGNTPFRILRAACSDARVKCSVVEKTKALYLVSVTFAAGEAAGKVSDTIVIETDTPGGKPLEVPLYVSVMPRGPTTF